MLYLGCVGMESFFLRGDGLCGYAGKLLGSWASRDFKTLIHLNKLCRKNVKDIVLGKENDSPSEGKWYRLWLCI